MTTTYKEVMEFGYRLKERLSSESKECLLAILEARITSEVVTNVKFFGKTGEEAMETSEKKILAEIAANKKIARLRSQNKRGEALLKRIDSAWKKGGDCNDCEHWRSRGSKKKGKRIPGGFGKCCRSEGHCSPAVTNKGIG